MADFTYLDDQDYVYEPPEIIESTTKGETQAKLEKVIWATGYHLTRIPLYIVGTLLRAPLGFLRLGRLWWGWVSDPRFFEDRTAVMGGATGSIETLNADHDHKVRVHGTISFVAFLAFVGYNYWAWRTYLWQHCLLVCLAVWFLVGLFGYKKHLAEEIKIEKNGTPQVNESLILKGLAKSIGQKEEEHTVTAVSPVIKTQYGWQMEARLGDGIPASKALKRASDVAAMLDRPVNCVQLIDEDSKSASVVKVVVLKETLDKLDISQDWPLKNKSWNYHKDKKLPVGVSTSGEIFYMPKRHLSSAYGGMMDMGKTVSMQTSLIGMLKDPRVEAHIMDLKGGFDWMPFEPVLHYYRSGDDQQDHEANLANLVDLQKRMNQRYDRLKYKYKQRDIDDRIANEPDMHPIVIVLDECQLAFDSADKKRNQKYLEVSDDLVRRGRAVSITSESTTQKLNRAGLPIVEFCGGRVCHKVTDHYATELVLGASEKAGYYPHKWKENYKGIAYMGSGGDYTIVKSFMVDLDKEIADIFDERNRLHRLTGMAAGDIPVDNSFDSFADRVKGVWPEGVKSLQWVELVSLMHDAYPGEWPEVGDITGGMPADVKSACDSMRDRMAGYGAKPLSVRSEFKSVSGGSGTRKGCRLADIDGTGAEL